MDTKSKSKPMYKIILILSIFLISLSSVTVLDIIKNNHYLNTNYYDSSDFADELYKFYYKFLDFYSSDKNFNNPITESQLYSLSNDYSIKLDNEKININNRYIDDITNARENNNSAELKHLNEEKTKKIEEATQKNTKTEEELKIELVNRKTQEYSDLKEKVYNDKSILFYVRDKDKKLYSNIDNAESLSLLEYIDSNSIYNIKFPLESTNNSYSTKYFYEMNTFFKAQGATAYFIIPSKNSEHTPVIEGLFAYMSMKRRILIEFSMLSASIAIGLALLIYLKKKNVLATETSNSFISKYFKLPLDLKFIIFATFSTYSLYTYTCAYSFYNTHLQFNHFFELAIISFYIYYLICVFTDIRKLILDKEYLKRQKSNLLLLNSIKRYINILLENQIDKKVITKVAGISLVLCILIYIPLLILILCIPLGFNRSEILAIVFSFIYFPLYLVSVPLYFLKKVSALQKIILATEEITSGNLDCTLLDAKSGSGMLLELSNNINNICTKFKNIDESYKKSIEERLKSERLKSELITNVSHDLKTPLTSIINYVDLLKRPNLSEDEMKSYINILDRKATRLKVLIEDLFEASKLTSGNVELYLENIDVNSLLKQALGEFDERIKKSSLTFKINTPKEKVLVNLDGKKTWRVFENLLGNILKYSLPNTRVYIDLIEDKDKVLLIMKNISSYEMDFNVNEIFERFKRGDKSRNTEGSGLGLAIAKSLVELQGGTLDVEIDGDLFKAIIMF